MGQAPVQGYVVPGTVVPVVGAGGPLQEPLTAQAAQAAQVAAVAVALVQQEPAPQQQVELQQQVRQQQQQLQQQQAPMAPMPTHGPHGADAPPDLLTAQQVFSQRALTAQQVLSQRALLAQLEADFRRLHIQQQQAGNQIQIQPQQAQALALQHQQMTIRARQHTLALFHQQAEEQLPPIDESMPEPEAEAAEANDETMPDAHDERLKCADPDCQRQARSWHNHCCNVCLIRRMCLRYGIPTWWLGGWRHSRWGRCSDQLVPAGTRPAPQSPFDREHPPPDWMITRETWIKSNLWSPPRLSKHLY